MEDWENVEDVQEVTRGSAVLGGVDPFFGTAEWRGAESDAVMPNLKHLPRVDRKWKPIREPFGATHPGASQAHGMVSCVAFGLWNCPYEPGYPAGYNGEDFFGFGHFTQSGTGTIRWYYNYLLTTPGADFSPVPPRRKMSGETAAPGWYRCELSDGIVCENIALDRSILHWFRFPAGQARVITLNAKHVFLPMDPYWEPPPGFAERFPERGWVRLGEDCEKAQGSGLMMMDGHPVYFAVTARGPGVTLSVFADGAETDEREVQIGKHPEQGFGLVVRAPALEEEDSGIELRIGFSFRSAEQAAANLEKEMPAELVREEVLAKAQAGWSACLGKWAVAGGDRRHRELFFNCLYKTNLKPVIAPADWGENPLWAEEPFVADIATTWDLHGTAIPLLLLTDREAGAELVRYFVRALEYYGCFPPAVMMARELPWVFSKQASQLGCVILAEAYRLGYDGFDWETILERILESLQDARGKVYLRETPLAPSITHNLDYAYGYFCAAQIAEGLGKRALAADLRGSSRLWKRLYDRQTGLLKEFLLEEHVETEEYPRRWFRFYEGNRWTYSFRLWHDMESVMEHVGRERFVERLDEFFGFSGDGQDAHFQGLNNESDYTAPFAYDYAGRPERRQQVVRLALLHRFGPGRGGLPGNDDSGALSSWVVWNAMGLFPVAGQGLYLIGSPLFAETTLSLSGGRLRIVADTPAEENAFVEEASWDGVTLDRLYLRYEEIAGGGTLRLRLTDEPPEAGKFRPPPSLDPEQEKR